MRGEREGDKERGEGRCRFKSLWAFKRLLPYCFETVQSDIGQVAQRTADHTEPAIKTLWTSRTLQRFGLLFTIAPVLLTSDTPILSNLIELC